MKPNPKKHPADRRKKKKIVAPISEGPNRKERRAQKAKERHAPQQEKERRMRTTQKQEAEARAEGIKNRIIKRQKKK